ncbi:MAG: NACHT domain-containing protein [Desulfobacterales bacterium]|nr:NACHT domain-containing protein [Desulfobacterales bacterium]
MLNNEVLQSEIDDKIKSAIPYEGQSLPLTQLDDRVFEILLYTIFKKRIEHNDIALKDKFDKIDLMQGVAEQGQDCLLTLEGKRVGLIQCKQMNSNLTQPAVAKEIIKFVLYYLQDNSLIDDIQNYTYFFAVSKGFAGTAITFLSNFNKNILNEPERLKSWTNDVIKNRNCKSLNDLKYDAIEKDLKKVLSVIKVEKIIPEDIERWLNEYSTVIEMFFSVRKVIDNPQAQKPDIQKISEFEKEYRDQLISRHKHITPPDFDANRKLPVDDLFVSPRFIRPPRVKGEEPEELAMSAFLSDIYRTVVIGNPGAGKTTFASKICYDLANQYSKRFIAKRPLTPILVILRDYGARRKDKNCSILQFIESTSNTTYQIQPPLDAFEHLLSNGHAVVIFDGLDELLDTSYRQKISGDIEAFCTLYPSIPVIVTSREVGYEQAPLDTQTFKVFQIAPLNKKQIEEYVKKWFSLETRLPAKEQEQKEKAFINESQIVPDLRSNPLMLALMCNIYRGESYIPKNRPDIYEKCAVMLFERWDKGRAISVPLPFEAHLRPAMMYLAHWIYSDEKHQGGVIEQKLIAKTAEYLCPRRFEDKDEAEEAARQFVEFTKGRAWVFTDTGSTKDGDSLYQFTHRTFLEYFTADYLVRTNATPKELGKFLQPKIAKQEWDVVAQLAFQIQNKKLEDAGDELLTALIEHTCKDDIEKGSYLYFAARCLEFMIPSPKVTRLITFSCIEYCINWGLRQLKSKHDSDSRYIDVDETLPEVILHHLITTAEENFKTISDCIENVIVCKINGGNDQESIMALEIGLILPYDIFDRIFENCTNRITELSPRNFRACLESFHRQRINISKLIEWHGTEKMFEQFGYNVFSNMWTIPIAESLITLLLQKPHFYGDSIAFNRLNTNLEEIYVALFNSYESWTSIQFDICKKDNFIWYLIHEEYKEVEQPLKLSSDAFFAAFVLIAVALEMKHGDFNRIKNAPLHFFDFLRWVFIARFSKVESNKVQSELDNCGFTDKQQAFVWGWIRKEFDLVKKQETAGTE